MDTTLKFRVWERMNWLKLVRAAVRSGQYSHEGVVTVADHVILALRERDPEVKK